MPLHPAHPKRRLGPAFAAVLLGASALAGHAWSQDAAGPSPNATVNLIRALVAKGVLAQAEADAMIAQAEAEAVQARAVAQKAQVAAAAASPASAQPGTSVRYVPQFVRDEIKQELRAEVLADAKAQGLVAPDALPEWVRGVTLSGDLRLRGEGRFFDDGNAMNFVNIAAINAGAPYNTDPASNPYNPPILNSGKDRNYARIRARLALEARIDEDLTAHLRIATGSDNSPVSTNQTLGGFYAKKDLWLDQAYVDFRPVEGARILAGRMANPFHMADLVWDDDINLDGLAASYGGRLGDSFSAYGLLGAFPLDYVPDDFPSTAFASNKTDAAKNRWLFAGQAGATWKADDAVRLAFSAAYYDYSGVAGALSPSCVNTAQYCLTDYRRPGFAQKGNTLFALRDNFTLDPTNQASPQYYGLASEYRVLALGGELDWRIGDDLALALTAQWAKNLAYDKGEILARGFNRGSGVSQIVNNNETCSVPLVGGLCPAGSSVYDSGDTAWFVQATIGAPKVEKLGDWSLTASYRYIEPDALLDAFTNSDFRLGGTNAKGWVIGGSYGLRRNTSAAVRWMNAEEVSGPPFRVDLLQVDLNVKF